MKHSKSGCVLAIRRAITRAFGCCNSTKCPKEKTRVLIDPGFFLNEYILKTWIKSYPEGGPSLAADNRLSHFKPNRTQAKSYPGIVR